MVIKLSEWGIKNAIDWVKGIKSDIIDANGQIVKELVDYGGEVAKAYNAVAPRSSNQTPSVTTDCDESAGKGVVALEGRSAVYDEFGTGEEGADDGHPWKYMFPLNPYNSGPFVSTHINKNGRHYWYVPSKYKVVNDYTRESGYTEGIPSGKQMYNTAKSIRNKEKEIIERRLNSALSKYNR